MALTRLDPDADYSDEDTSTFYHGINAYQLEGILDRGADVSKNRRESSGYDLMEAHLHEDIIRILGADVTRQGLGDVKSVREYVEEHREDLEEHGSDYTRWLLEDTESSIERGLAFVDNLVWVSRDEQEARNYSAKRDIPGCEKRSGGYFEFELPNEAVLEMGLNGGVPGEIPLEYAETLRLENMESDEREEIWLEFVSTEYDVEIKSV